MNRRHILVAAIACASTYALGAPVYTITEFQLTPDFLSAGMYATKLSNSEFTYGMSQSLSANPSTRTPDPWLGMGQCSLRWTIHASEDPGGSIDMTLGVVGKSFARSEYVAVGGPPVNFSGSSSTGLFGDIDMWFTAAVSGRNYTSPYGPSSVYQTPGYPALSRRPYQVLHTSWPWAQVSPGVWEAHVVAAPQWQGQLTARIEYLSYVTPATMNSSLVGVLKLKVLTIGNQVINPDYVL